MGQNLEGMERMKDGIDVAMDFKPQPVLCGKCDLAQAYYKKEMVVDDFGEVQKKTDLLEYWLPGLVRHQGDYLVTYTACKECMDKALLDQFQYKEDGWMSEPF
jgi:hypothetical protein